MFRVQPRKRGVEIPSIYTRFLGRIDKAAEETGIAYLAAVRQSILESPVKVREHVKTDDKGNVIMKEIHRETLPPDIRGRCGGLSAAFPSSSAAAIRWSIRARSKVQATQTQERKLTIELVKSDREVHRLTRDDDGEVRQLTRDDDGQHAEPVPHSPAVP